jgi:hypothetical protein
LPTFYRLKSNAPDHKFSQNAILGSKCILRIVFPTTTDLTNFGKTLTEHESYSAYNNMVDAEKKSKVEETLAGVISEDANGNVASDTDSKANISTISNNVRTIKSTKYVIYEYDSVNNKLTNKFPVKAVYDDWTSVGGRAATKTTAYCLLIDFTGGKFLSAKRMRLGANGTTTIADSKYYYKLCTNPPAADK